MKSAADQPSSSDTAKAAAEAADEDPELLATVTSVKESGDLCPPRPTGSKVEYDGDGLSVLYFARTDNTCELGQPSTSGGCSTTPTCTVTLELEVPAGYRMGVPKLTWVGGVDVYPDPSGITTQRTYAFEGGDTVRTPAESLAVSSFMLTDRGIDAFSSTCSGSTHTRLVATFRAQLPDNDRPFWLDQLIITPSLRDGTQFQSCSSGGPAGIQAARDGDWCGGATQRPCASGLVCERYQASMSEDDDHQMRGTSSEADPMSLGTCVDPAESAPPQEENKFCGGARNIACTEGNVCWYQSGVDRSALGLCVPAVGRNKTLCHVGTPWIDCGAGLVCDEDDKRCVTAPGKNIGDACSEIDFPRCEDPLICRAGSCVLPRGRQGDPCGDDYPACESGECVFETCRDWDAENVPCGDGLPACAQGKVCFKGRCTGVIE